MDPIVDELDAVGRLGLGDLVLVVGEDVVDAAAVDVEGRAQVAGAHGRALDVPARPARTDLGVPGGLARLGRLPQGEVVDALLLVLVGIAAGPGPAVLEADLGQAPIGRELVDGEIDRAVLAVGDALVEQRPDEGDHAGDVLGIGGPRVVIGRQDVQPVPFGEEGLDVGRGVCRQADSLGVGPLDGLVVDVRDVHDVEDPVAPVEQEALEEVLEDVGAPIADMGVVVDGRAAGVQLDHAGLEGDEVLDPAAEGVVESHHLPPILWIRRASVNLRPLLRGAPGGVERAPGL